MRAWIDAPSGAVTPSKAAVPLVSRTLATASAGIRQRAAASLLCIGFLSVTLFLLPIVSQPMPAMPAFLAINQSALVLVYGLTTALLYAQFRRTRSIGLLMLGAGRLYTTLVLLTQLLSFPDMFVPGLLLGSGSATLTWLWNFWHLGPPLVTLPYAVLEGIYSNPSIKAGRERKAAVASVAVVCCAGAFTAWLAVHHAASLPVLLDSVGSHRSLMASGIGFALFGLNAGSLLMLCWLTRLRRVLQLWVAVSLFLLLLDNVVTDPAAAYTTIGCLLGRIEALLAATVVLGVYLYEIDFLRGYAEEATLAGEHVRAEAESVRENLEIALEASNMGEWALDLATDTSRRNLRHDRLFGYAEMQSSWGRARMMQHVHPEDHAEVEAAFDKAQRDGKLTLEFRILRAGDNMVRWVSLQGRTYYDKTGRPTTMAGCIVDVTDRKETEDKLRQSEHMEAIGQLTGGVAHDFNNLLTILLGSLEIIVRKPEDVEQTQSLGKAALGATRRGIELTDKLLSFSRKQIMQEQLVNANRLLSEFQPLIQRAVGESVTVELALDASLHPTRLDPNQLQATLLNMAGNARDAMPGGGRLRLETRNVTLTVADVATVPDARPGRYVQITMQDNGFGMDKATASHAFEPFFTTKEVGRGTGLGLSQVYGFVRQAGGHCRLSSAPGQGCSVELYFPESVEASAAMEDTRIVPLRRTINGDVVLIIEDEDSLREFAAESLSGLGYGVLTAPDARVALTMLKGPNRIDILFSDIVMPGGMNGAQLAMEAKAIRPNLKVLLTSGYNLTATGGVRELPDDVPLLRKPYMRDELAARLQAVS